MYQYDRDFTGEGYTVGPHGASVASTIIAGTNNGIGPTSIGGLTARIKVISGKVINSQRVPVLTAMNAGFRYALDLKAQGKNIVAINCSFHVGGNDTTLQLLELLKQQGIYVFAAASENSPVGVNMDIQPAELPAGYGALPKSNVFGMAALDADGQSLLPKSNYGPNTIALAAPGYNVPVVSFLDQRGDAAIAADTSVASAEGAAAYAVIREYYLPLRQYTDAEAGAIAADRLRASAAMFPALLGKVGYGRVDVYAALTMAVGLPASGLGLYTEQDSPRAVALDSVVFSRDPFTITTPFNFSADHRARIILYANNLPSTGGVTVQFQTVAGQIFTATPENIGKIQSSDPFTQINVRVPDSVTAGDVWVSIVANGVASNKGFVTFKP